MKIVIRIGWLTILLAVLAVPAAAQFSVEIWEVQGASHRSSLVGANVVLQNNLVTAIERRGFYMQTPAHLFPTRDDGNPATSNGILVFTNAAPPVLVGDMVTVSGRVTEFRPGDDADKNLSITEITQPQITVIAHGYDLPPATVIGTGGRVPPTAVINDDGPGNVEIGGTFDHDADGLDFFESLEGMRVRINGAHVVSPSNAFGEFWVVGDNGASAGVLSPRGGIVLTPGDFNPERIQIDNDLYPGEWPSLNVGARIPTPVIGVMAYGFQNYRVFVTELFTAEPGELAREVTPLTGSRNQLTVGTYNVENLGGRAQNATFDTRAVQIVDHMRSPDIVVLQEVQDNDGTGNSATVDANTTLTKLIAAVQRAGGPLYRFTQINPEDDQDGGAPGGNIRVAMLYNPERVQPVSGTAGDAITAAEVICDARSVTLNRNPVRIDPTNNAFRTSRKPLVSAFTFRGETVYVVGVHLNSKGGDDPLMGFAQPPVFNSESQRRGQAAAINGFVRDLLTCDPNANLVVLGDFNDFWFSAPLDLLEGRLHNLDEMQPLEERYSYVYQGNSQVLDQILVSDNLLMQAEMDIVHINAEFADQVTDHDPSVARFTLE